MWDDYGLGVQPQSPHFTMSYRLGVAQISDKIPKAWSTWAAVRGGDTSICISTAYKGFQTLFIYIIWMWDEYGLGLQPQSPHFTMSYRLGVAQISGKIPQARSTWAAVRGGDTSICISTAYKGCQTPYIYIIWMWDEYGLCLQPQSSHFTIIYQLRLAQISSKIPQARSTWAAGTWCGQFHMHIHSI